MPVECTMSRRLVCGPRLPAVGVVLLSIVLLVAGCQPASLRPAWVPDLPDTDLATVEVSRDIHILKVDQQDLDMSRPTKLKLDPGRHVLRFYLHLHGGSSSPVDASVTLDRGRLYLIRIDGKWRPDRVAFVVVDSVTGAVLWTSQS